MKKKLFLITTAVLICLPLIPLFSTETDYFTEFDESLGFIGGRISGTGLSYQTWKGGFGYQITGGIIYLPEADESWYENALDYAVGVEVQRPVFTDYFAKWFSGQLYFFGGANHYGYVPVELVAEGYYENPDDYEGWVEPVYRLGLYSAKFGVGVGIGIEILLFKHFSIPIEFGYGAFYEPSMPELKDQFEVNTVVQSGIRYRY
jgi:hypothetical protein